MSHVYGPSATPSCIVPGVQPVLTELQDSIATCFCSERDSRRAVLEQFIRGVFKQAFGAELQRFYPNLLSFSSAGRIRGVVGYRDGLAKPLFSEQYLDAPAEKVIGIHMGQDIDREQLVEVGNLALTDPGEVRWVIAAVTVLLYAAGYRWVLFTAVKPLYNAFRRLGLRPIQIANPDPGRLHEDGNNWGSYYQAGPVVCAGDITAGYYKLITSVTQRQPLLSALLQDAFSHGLKARCEYAGTIGEAV